MNLMIKRTRSINQIMKKHSIILIFMFYELILIAYIVLVFKPFFLNLIIATPSVFVYGSIILSIILIYCTIVNNKYYWSINYFRLGLILTLIAYMVYFNEICTLCIKYHILVIVGFIIISIINYFKIKYHEKS